MRTPLALLVALAVAGCGDVDPDAPARTPAEPAATPAADPGCDDDDGGLALPDGFCARVFGEAGAARHLAVADDGTVYVKRSGAGVVALRDTTGDGRADVREEFGDFGGTGIGIHGGYLYASSDDAVYRWPLPAPGAVPEGKPEVVVSDFPPERQHAAKSIAFDDAGNLYVNVGAPSNACQSPDRSPGTPGQDPCPLLETTGGVWRYAADQTGQRHRPEARFATGIRNAVALAWNPADGALYAVQHGRDQLSQLWPDLYSEQDNAELPSEEFLRLTEGADAGWPYCYHDPRQGRKVLAPEYGGDGREAGRCADALQPVAAFPAHWAPNGLAFYTGDAFPARYRGGAFVAFHGSWNRAPLPQAGYNVAFVPMSDGRAAGAYEVFADGFAGSDRLESPGDADFRPMGVAEGPDGALYIGDSVEGRVWRVVYAGSSTD